MRIIAETKDFIKQIYLNRSIIYELTKRDFKSRYVTDVFGLSWAIIEPLAMMLILWFVFTYLRGGSHHMTVPFPLFLLSGLIIYDFFNKTLNSATRSIKNFNFLIRKVNFRIAIVPLVKISTEIIIHMIILVIVVIIFLANHQHFNIMWLQVFYYLFAASMMLTGLTWFTSAVVLFFPDINYLISILMRVLFFFTPIFWTPNNIPARFRIFFEVNPLFYLVNGYRDSLLFHKPFWEKPEAFLLFWSVTAMCFIIGVFTFKKLRPHFADVV